MWVFVLLTGKTYKVFLECPLKRYLSLEVDNLTFDLILLNVFLKDIYCIGSLRIFLISLSIFQLFVS